MDIRFVAPNLRRLDQLKTEALVLPVFQNERPLRGTLGLADWRLCGQISRLILTSQISGAFGEKALLPARPRLTFDKLFLFGVGESGAFDEARFDTVVELMLTTLDSAKVRASVLALPGRSSELIEAATAVELFLRRGSQHAEQDVVTLIEDGAGERAMQPVVERERRRVLAFEL